jgi:group I intron endonuclease
MRVVFKVTNLVNSKIYIGKTSYNRDAYYGSGKAIKNAILKYGISNFKKEILDTADSLAELNEKEKYWISKYQSYNPLIGYNRSYGGDGNWEHMTPEVLEQRRSNQLKAWASPEFKEKKRSDTLKYYQNPENRKAQSTRVRQSYFNLSTDDQDKVKKRLLDGTIKSWQNPEKRKKASDHWKTNNPMMNPEIAKRVGLSRLGQNNPAATPCEIDNIHYPCIIDAMRALNLTRNTISGRLRSPKFPNYKKLKNV